MPLDPAQLRLALQAVLDGADAVVRLSARLGAGLDDIRADAQLRDATRLAGKPGASAGAVAGAYVRANRTRAQAEAGKRTAARSRIPPFPIGPELVGLHAHVADRNGRPLADLDVHVMAETGLLVAEARTDHEGYFRVEFSATATQMQGNPVVMITVRRGDHIVWRDPQWTRLRIGRTRYRDIIADPS